jgi:response regulator RpfG family c-di-GMP phosphodiesterase/DNA-binding SARP family transcriptional activator
MDRILIVDDDQFMRGSLQMELEAEGFHVVTAENGTRAIELAKEQSFDLVLCDVRMPDIGGIETIAAIKELQPVAGSIVITGYASQETPISALKLRVDDYLMKPFSIDNLLKSIRSTLVRLKQNLSRSEGVARYRRNFLKIITGILFESKISYLVGHAERVARLSLLIGRSLGLSSAQLQNLHTAAVLHDVGYVELPPHLMDKKEFIEQDYQQIKNHPLLAKELLAPFKEMKEISTMIFHHHERWDGSGYPGGLKGEKIPVESRIIAVAEAYDSLVSDRPHRGKKTVHEALKSIEKDAASAFDPAIVKVLPPLAGLYEENESPLLSYPDSDANKRITLLLNLADVYREQGGYEMAMDACAKAFEYLSDSEDHELRVRAGMEEVMVLSDQEKLQEALSRALQFREEAERNSLAFMKARLSLQISSLRMRLGIRDGVEDDLRTAREIFRVWESSYEICTTDLLMSYYCATGGDELTAGFRESFDSFVKALLEGHFFDLLRKYGELSHVVVRKALESRGEQKDLASLFRDPQKAPLEILEKLMEDRNGAVRLRVLDILKEVKDARAQALIAKAQIDPDSAVSEKSTRLVRALPEVTALPPVRIFFFGKFRVSVGDTLLDEEVWVTRKAKSLFAYIVSRLGEEAGEERLMDIFWLQGGSKALHSLHNCISLIRKIFTPYLGQSAKNILQNRKAGYVFNTKIGCQIDLKEFNELFHRGRTLFEQDDWSLGLAELQKAERLYTGDFMEGSYDEWSDDLRLSTRNRFIELLSLLGTYFFRKAKYEVSMDYWKKLISHDNCFEDAYFGLMLCHVAADSRNEAIKIYHQCTQTLKKELELPPPAKVAEIYLKLIEGQNVPLVM